MYRILIAAALVAAATITAPVGASAAVNSTTSNDKVFSIFSSKNKKKVVIKKKKDGTVTVRRTAKKTPDRPVNFAANQPKEKKVRLVAGEKCTFLNCLFGENRTPRRARNISINRQYASLSRPIFGASRASGVSGATSRSTVAWTNTQYPVGSIVVKTPERSLYYVLGNGQAVRYKVGVGKEGFQWSGTNRISRKAEWPSWTPPQEMIEREAEKGNYIPDFMEGGPGNPLGARALYIGGTIYRIHGTNNERSIGGAVSSGCIRMMNADVIDLYRRVQVGARIYVYQ